MRPRQATILLILLSSRVFCQITNNDSLRVAYADFDANGRFRLIPENALAGYFDLLVIPPDYSSIAVIKKQVMNISWPSSYIDGRYSLIVTPKQIYFRSGHDNPKPSYLYWLASINSTQYESIRDLLERLSKTGMIKDSSTSPNSYHRYYIYNKAKREKYFRGAWKNKGYDNFIKLLELFNAELRGSDEEISVPDQDEFNGIRQVRIVVTIGAPDR